MILSFLSKIIIFWAEKFGDNWDGTVLHNALQILRCDPSSATGFSPAELIMGRPVVYPFELRQSDIDFSGNCIKKKFRGFDSQKLTGGRKKAGEM